MYMAHASRHGTAPFAELPLPNGNKLNQGQPFAGPRLRWSLIGHAHFFPKARQAMNLYHAATTPDVHVRPPDLMPNPG